MPLSAVVFFGLLSTALMLASRGTYFYSIYKGETKPHAFSWLIWAVISCIGFAAQFAEGAGAGSWARGVSAATCVMLVFIGLRWGEKNITRGDWVTLFVALLAVPLWIVTKTPLYSVILVVLIDTIGYMPTVRKVRLNPHQETPFSYILSGFCALFSLFAIEHYTPSTWLYPAVLTATNAGMAFYILHRKNILKQALATSVAVMLCAGTAQASLPQKRPATFAPTVAHVVIYKAERRLDLVDPRGVTIDSYKVVLGKNPVGDKLHEGDNRTPEGRYTIDTRNPNSSYYLSLRISYPNARDVAEARSKGLSPGGEIFIHGMPNDKGWMWWKYNTMNDWTNGCVALSNKDIRELWERVADGTPITIRP
jgi:L,D-peptidoglycan transpeptidase YkuD (ErfK/YbiS/YcfS/YnhG family)